MKHYIAIILLLAGITLPTFAQDYPPAILERPNVSTNPNATTVSIRFVAYADSILARLAWFEARAAEQPAAQDPQAQRVADLLAKLEPVAEKAARTVAMAPPYSVTWKFSAAPSSVAAVVIERKDADGGSWTKLAELPPTATTFTDPARPLGRFTYRRSYKAADGTLSVVSHLPTAVLLAPTP